MATGQTRLASLSRQTFLAATLPSRPPSKIRLIPPKNRVFCSLPLDPKDTLHLISRNNRAGPIGPRARARARARARVSDSELRENWLDSLSCPFPETGLQAFGEGKEVGSGPGPADWVIGIDPDVAGALALLKGNGSDLSAQVFDTPYLQVLVGKRARKRLDTRSIVQMIHSFGAPQGTTAYIEQSHPFPQDGKQGWWSTGFTYGLWIGILVASGFSVVPVSSRLWKDQFELARNSSTKDDSRKAASVLFPSLTCSLKRKKDHGRAEALLIAAYGKGLRLQSDSSTTQEQHTLTPA